MLNSSEADGLSRPDARPAMSSTGQSDPPAVGRRAHPDGHPAHAAQHRGRRRSLPAEIPGRHQLTIGSIALLLFAVMSAATGQVLLKHGMQLATARATATSTSLALRPAPSPSVLFAPVVFAVSATASL